MPFWPFWPTSIGCLILFISVTRSAASMRRGSYDATSRMRWLTTVVMPSPRIETP